MKRLLLGLAVAVGVLVAGCTLQETSVSSTPPPVAPSLPVAFTVVAPDPVLIPDPAPGADVVSDVHIVRPFAPVFRLGTVLAHHVDDQHLDVATLVVGDGAPVGMIDDGTLTSLFGQPARHFVPDGGATADRLCQTSAVVLADRRLTVWANDPAGVLTALGDIVGVDGDTINVGKLPPGDELIEPAPLPSGGFTIDYAVGTEFHVSMSTQSATVPAGCGPWTAVEIGGRTAWASPQGPPQPIGVSPAALSWQAGEWSSVTVSGTGSLDDVIAFARKLTLVTTAEFAARHPATIPTAESDPTIAVAATGSLPRAPTPVTLPANVEQHLPGHLLLSGAGRLPAPAPVRR